MKYKTTVGLEIHIELNTKSKMFCGCLNDSEEKQPNKNVCGVCLGHPGMLPVINEKAVEKVIKADLALGCDIATESFFERKNYFYPDLPKGYQISQYQAPLCREGFLELSGVGKKIRIERIHLEEDTGSLAHPDKANYSLINFNRSSVPLMELVTQPDLESATEAREFAKELQLILRYLDVSGANMEKGEMRVEVNISLRPENQKEFGTKVEIKNLNSIRSVEKSIEFEIKRQAEILEKGEKVVQETRGWHDAKEITFSQRSKEEAHDYRYFPEPDLPPLEIKADYLEEIKAHIPELPSQKRERFKKEYGLQEEIFIIKPKTGDFWEQTASELSEWIGSETGKAIKGEERKRVIDLVTNYSVELQGVIRSVLNMEMEDLILAEKFNITAEDFAEFIKMIYLGQISSKIAKMVLIEMVKTGQDPSDIIEANGWQMVSDEGEIEKAVAEVISANAKAAEDFKNGKQASFQFLLGQVMAKTHGKAKPELASQILKKQLS
ncbi:MAG: Asp-tRNA(Asn)/Glu-tRNA(Gln) amidotransferase subunit GatB [Candidatus Gribaldobacteria bacterium]|nr:Asp-tRNA(Asn)/Glu-tRNA(Gln) amidotransferase subunit GatB [Candidatus Gribaldobacteria bacterium]